MIRLPLESDTADHLQTDIVVAIELGSSGEARGVVLAGLPGVEAVAAEAVGYAEVAHVRFALWCSPGAPAPAVVVGPLEA